MPFLIFAMIANAINQGSVFPYFAKVSKSIERRRSEISVPIFRSVAKSTISTKFQDFSVFQILCEINFEGSKSSKTATFAILGALFFVNLVNFSLKMCKN